MIFTLLGYVLDIAIFRCQRISAMGLRSCDPHNLMPSFLQDHRLVAYRTCNIGIHFDPSGRAAGKGEDDLLVFAELRYFVTLAFRSVAAFFEKSPESYFNGKPSQSYKISSAV